MNWTKNIISVFAILLVLGTNMKLDAQDPNFSQFFASPLTINPALTSDGESNWRAMTNIRTQTIGIGSPYSTQSFSIDGKLKKMDDDNFLGIGGMILADRSMEGAFKSTYINLNASYHLSIDSKGNGLAVGLGFINNNTRVDYSSLTTDQQLSNTGFDRALPTGEPNLNPSISYSSACAGIMFTHVNDYSFLNVGIAGYRFVNSSRSLLDNRALYVSPRYDIHADFGTVIHDDLNVTFSAIHLIQNGTSATSLGSSLAFGLRPDQFDMDQRRMLNAGIYYRLGDAVIPYIGYTHNEIQFGLSYDVNVSSVKSGSVSTRSFEISLIYKRFSPNSTPRMGRYHSPI
jgi:type IX secretion system PorP/SprF family membrane protein